MTRYVYRPDDPQANENGMVDASVALPPGVDPHIYGIADEMPATRHMATGEYFTSKAKFRQRTRDAGCVEVGTDTSVLRPRQPVRMDRQKRVEDIQRAIYQLRNR